METKVGFGWHTVKALGEFLATSLQRKRYERVQINDLRALLSSNKSISIVDCRDAEDYADGHIPGAVNIPFQEFMKTYTKAPKADAVVTVCYVGMYSRAAAQKLSQNGYGIVSSLDGGMDAWLKAKGPTTTDAKATPKEE